MHDLAWELAKAARPHLRKAQANPIYVAIGAGDTFDAIDMLITLMARHQIPLCPDLVTAAAAWLDGYRGQDAEPRLRDRLDEVRRHSPPCVSPFERRFGSALVAARVRSSGG